MLSRKKSARDGLFLKGVRNRLLTLIEKAGSQIEIARRSGLSVQRVNKYVKGLRNPDIEGLAKIASAMNVTADWILFGEEKNGGGVEKTLDNHPSILYDDIKPLRDRLGLTARTAARRTTGPIKHEDAMDLALSYIDHMDLDGETREHFKQMIKNSCCDKEIMEWVLNAYDLIMFKLGHK